MFNKNKSTGPIPPAPGTYPPLDAAPEDTMGGEWQQPAEAPTAMAAGAPAAVAEPPQKTRRVGTFTSAITLIVFGTLMVVRLFVQSFDYLLVIRLAPLVLVALGIEILLANAFAKNAKLKYDVLSVLLSLILVAGSLVAALVPEFLLLERQSYEVGNRLAAELNQTSYERLRDSGLPIQSVKWYVYLNQTSFSTDMDASDLRPQDNVQAQVYLSGEFTTKGAFAQTARKVLNELQTMAPHIDYVSMYTANWDSGAPVSGNRYGLWTNSVFELNLDAAGLENLVEAHVWSATANDYMEEDYYYRMLQNPNYNGHFVQWDDGVVYDALEKSYTLPGGAQLTPDAMEAQYGGLYVFNESLIDYPELPGGGDVVPAGD